VIRALIRNPKIILLDEYTSFLDEKKKKLVRKFIYNYWKNDKQ
jgi:ABC-type iron transport system FetAB ATPase subunit